VTHQPTEKKRVWEPSIWVEGGCDLGEGTGVGGKKKGIAPLNRGEGGSYQNSYLGRVAVGRMSLRGGDRNKKKAGTVTEEGANPVTRTPWRKGKSLPKL